MINYLKSLTKIKDETYKFQIEHFIKSRLNIFQKTILKEISIRDFDEILKQNNNFSYFVMFTVSHCNITVNVSDADR